MSAQSLRELYARETFKEKDGWAEADIEIVHLYSLRFRIELGFKVAKHVTGGVLYHFWMAAMDRLGRNPKTQHLHHKGEGYRNAVRRKLRAYHCFLQAGVIAQGLMTVIGILVPNYCWSNYSSWMRTMNVSRTPSEWVVQHVLRKTFAELLADASTSPNWVKFIRERMDLKRYSFPSKAFQSTFRPCRCPASSSMIARHPTIFSRMSCGRKK